MPIFAAEDFAQSSFEIKTFMNPKQRKDMKQTFVFCLLMLANPFMCLASNDIIVSLANIVNRFKKVFHENTYFY